MTRAIRRAATALAFLLSFSAAHSQYTAKKIVFTDPGPYNQQDLETLVGIHPGQAITTDDLSAAVQKISDSSYFGEVSATVDGPVKAVSVIFTGKPVPQDQLVGVSYDNFVWFTPAELAAAIHAPVPLFRGYLPVSGATVDKAEAALRQLLASKQITGDIARLNSEPSFGHPDRVIVFGVVKHSVVVGSVAFTGAPTAIQPLIDKQIQLLTGKRYSEGRATLSTAEVLLLPLQDAGYINAKLTSFERTAADSAQRTEVSVKATVDPGEIYRVASLTYPGSAIYSSADFASGAKLKPEDIASRKLLVQTLAPIDAAYRNHGYMDAVADITATLDPATHHVAYVVTVTPGEIYKVNSVTPTGLSAAAQRDFDRGWLLKPGEVYNPEYVATFLKHNTALQALAGYSANFKASADPDTHLVDLTITFAAGTAR